MANYVSLVCNYQDANGTPVSQGKVTFQPNAQVLDTSTDHLILTQLPVTVDLSQSPSPTVRLLATDNTGMSPSGWSYLVSPQFPGAPPAQLFSLPYTGGATQNLSDLLPVVSSPVGVTGGTYTGPVVLDGSPPMQIPAGAGSGKVLTSDASGNVSWVAEPAGTAVTLAPTTVKTGNYTAAASDLVRADTTTGPFTITLPAAPANGTVIGVKLVATAAPASPLTIAAAGSDVFNVTGGATSAVLSLNKQAITLQYVSSGAIWVVMGEDLPMSQVDLRQGMWWLDSFTGTDDQKMTAALTALFAAGGGTIFLSPRAHTFASQWTTAYTAGVATAVRIQGAGVAFNGAWGTPTATTTCTFTYSGGGAACTDFQHIGTIEITGIQLKSANAGIPLFQTTNAAPNLHDCIFSGGGNGTTCATDAILLGGTANTTGAGDTAKYNAYQGRIQGNFFDGIRRCVYFQIAANSVQVTGNTISANCGSNLYLGAPFEMLGSSAKSCSGNAIQGNCIEISGYATACKMSWAVQNSIGPNGIFDPVTALYVAAYIADSHCSSNEFADGFRQPSTPLVYGPGATDNNLSRSQLRGTGVGNIFNNPVAFRYNSGPPQSFYFGESVIGVAATGDQSYWRTDVPGYGFPTISPVTVAAATFTDGSTVNGSNVVTSATAAFVIGDTGQSISGGSIPSLASIQATFTTSTAPYWWPATPYALGDITRPVSASGHLYQATAAGTSGSSAPTFPTGGGTVTDGGVTWQDLGSCTAAVLSGPCTATATGVTIAISRSTGTTVSAGPHFGRGHMASGGTAPTVAVGAAGIAGTGATASVSGFDMAHAITLNTGTGTTAAGVLATVTFSLAYNSAPKFSLTAANAAAAPVITSVYGTSTAATFVLNAAAALAVSTTYIFDIVTVQ